jgi:hypothetical protein
MISQVANSSAALTGRAGGNPRLAGLPSDPAALPVAAACRYRNDPGRLTRAPLFRHCCAIFRTIF